MKKKLVVIGKDSVKSLLPSPEFFSCTEHNKVITVRGQWSKEQVIIWSHRFCVYLHIFTHH